MLSFVFSQLKSEVKLFFSFFLFLYDFFYVESCFAVRFITLTCSDQSKLVFFIANLLLLYIPSRKEKSHHALEELIHQLDCKWYNIHLWDDKHSISVKQDNTHSFNLK